MPSASLRTLRGERAQGRRAFALCVEDRISPAESDSSLWQEKWVHLWDTL